MQKYVNVLIETVDSLQKSKSLVGEYLISYKHKVKIILKIDFFKYPTNSIRLSPKNLLRVFTWEHFVKRKEFNDSSYFYIKIGDLTLFEIGVYYTEQGTFNLKAVNKITNKAKIKYNVSRNTIERYLTMFYLHFLTTFKNLFNQYLDKNLLPYKLGYDRNLLPNK